MNLIEIFGNSFLVGLSGAMMPGPLLIVALARTPKNGIRTGPVIVIGHAIVEIITVVLLSFGLATLVKDQPLVARIIAVVGGVALILMAVSMFIEINFFKTKRRGLGLSALFSSGAVPNDEGTSGDISHVRILRLVREGAIATISNPYWFVWWATIGSALIITSLKFGAVGPPVFFVGHILSDLAWYSFVALVVWQGKSFLTGRRYAGLIGVCAAFLLWLGGWFIYKGLIGAIEL